MNLGTIVVIAGLFSSAIALAERPQGVGEYRTDTLPATAPMVSWGGIGGVVVDTEGYIWQSNFGEYLWRIHPTSGEVTLFGEGFMSGSGVEALPRGDILLAEFGAGRIMRINRYRPNDIEVFSDEGLAGPVGLEFVPGRGVFVANCMAASISLIPEGGGAAKVFAEHELFNCPNGITSAPDGTLYVVNNSDTYVFSITPEGNTAVFAQLPGIGHGHVEYAAGALFVAQLWSHKVVRVDMDGNVTTIAGNGRPGLDDGPGASARVTHPNGIASNSGGSVLYHNSIDGPMLVNDGARLVIRRTYLPTVSRVLRQAFYADGADAMLDAHDSYAAAFDYAPGTFTPQVQSAAVALQQQQHHDAAFALLEHHLGGNEQDVATLRLLGDMHALYGDRNKARSLYKRALALEPEDTPLEQRLNDLP